MILSTDDIQLLRRVCFSKVMTKLINTRGVLESTVTNLENKVACTDELDAIRTKTAPCGSRHSHPYSSS